MDGERTDRTRTVAFTPEPRRSPVSVTIVERSDGEIRLAVHGELDLTSSALFEEHLEEYVTARARVVLDLGGVSFIDSTGLRALWMIRQRFAAVGGRLSLASLSPNVERLLHVTKLNKVFDQAI